MRAFIAIDLPEAIRTVLGQKQAELRASLAKENAARTNRDAEIRWTHSDGIHLTLKFLGEITEAQVTQVSETLSSFEPFESFSVEVKGFGFFPGAERPSVLWAGVEAPPGLARLAGQIEEKLEKLGYVREHRDFNPHLTLARFKAPRSRPTLRALVEQQNQLSIGRFEVSEFFLFESKLSPRGAEYRKVLRFPRSATL